MINIFPISILGGSRLLEVAEDRRIAEMGL